MNATHTPEEKHRHLTTILDDIRQRRAEIRDHWLHSIRLARAHGMTYRAIGDALGVTEDAVRKALKRAGGAV